MFHERSQQGRHVDGVAGGIVAHGMSLSRMLSDASSRKPASELLSPDQPQISARQAPVGLKLPHPLSAANRSGLAIFDTLDTRS